MLSAKRKSDGQTVAAYFERKSNGPFACLDCHEEVLLKMGRNRVSHFAHANPIACKFATGESEIHRRCKLEIFEALQRAVALVVVSESGKFNRVLSAAVADRLKADSVQILPSFFKPEFVSDGLFNAAFTEPAQIFKKLELANSLDAVLFAQQKVEYSTSPALENLITATMELELAVFPRPQVPMRRRGVFARRVLASSNRTHGQQQRRESSNKLSRTRRCR